MAGEIMNPDDPLFPHHLFIPTTQIEAKNHALRYLSHHEPDDVIFYFQMWLEKNNKVETYSALRYMRTFNAGASLVESADFQSLFIEGVVYQVEDDRWTLHKILLGRGKAMRVPAISPAKKRNQCVKAARISKRVKSTPLLPNVSLL
jgi:hypothetical protein